MEYMPRGGVNELLKSDSGRKYLGELQKRHRIDTLQPRNPDGSRNHEFDKVYGKRLERDRQLREKNERIANELKMELAEKKAAPKHHTDWKKKLL